MPKYRQIKAFLPFYIPNVVYKVRPYIYCTKKEVEDPEGLVLVKADIWMCSGEKPAGYNRKGVKTNFYPRCEIDIESRRILRKNGDVVEAVNVDNVIEFVRRHVFCQDELV